MPKYDIVVVGAGNAGLSAALQCQLAGRKTLLIEKHNVPGGAATSFVRGRFEFEASLHNLPYVGPGAENGDIGMLFLDNEMVSDHFCNGDTWEFGLMEYREKLDRPFTLYIAPLREGASVNVESAMAARNEEIRKTIAELNQIRIQPVYEMTL